MDGEKVPPALVGLPLPVDPGSRTFEAAGTDLKSEPVTVQVTEGGRLTLSLIVKSAPGTLAPGAAALAAPAAAPPPPPPATTAPAAGTESTTGGGASGMKIGAYVALGVGVVGAGVGTFFLLKANSKKSDADDLCSAPRVAP